MFRVVVEGLDIDDCQVNLESLIAIGTTDVRALECFAEIRCQGCQQVPLDRNGLSMRATEDDGAIRLGTAKGQQG